MTEYVYKLKNGKFVSAYADEKGNISITKEALEIMANSWNDGYQKGYSDGNLKGIEDAIEECIQIISLDIADCSKCPLDCEVNTYGACEEMLKTYVLEQLNWNS